MPEFNDPAPAPKPEKKDKKLKSSSTKKQDDINKNNTILGKTEANPSGKPNNIIINPASTKSVAFDTISITLCYEVVVTIGPCTTTHYDS